MLRETFPHRWEELQQKSNNKQPATAISANDINDMAKEQVKGSGRRKGGRALPADPRPTCPPAWVGGAVRCWEEGSWDFPPNGRLTSQ